MEQDWFQAVDIPPCSTPSSQKVRKGERHERYDKIVWKAVAKKMGFDRVRLMITGAAPTPPYLLESLKYVGSCPMIQGYGMTETSAVCVTKAMTVGHNGPLSM